MAYQAKAFWLGCVGMMLVASCVAPTATTPDSGSDATRRTSPTGKKPVPRPTGTKGETGGEPGSGEGTPDPNATPTPAGATPTPNPNATPTPAAAAFFAKVVDASGNPVVGADLRGFSSSATGFVAAVKTAKSDDKGVFELKAADSQPLNIEAAKDGLKAFKFNIAATSSNNTFTLQSPGTITGKVTASGVSDMTGAEVVIPGTDYKATTDAAGNFTMTGVPVGTFSLVASRGGLGTANMSDVKVEAGKTTTTANIAFSNSVPTITSLSPANGGKGVVVTITGTKFGTDSSKVAVTFAGVSATVNSVTDTEIKAVVPDGAVNGNVVVKVNGVASNARTFQAIAYVFFEVPKTTFYVGDTFTYKVIARDRDDAGNNAVVASPTITKWETDGSGFTVTPTGNNQASVTATLSATAGGTGKLRVYSGTEMEEISITVDATSINVSTLAGNFTTGAAEGPTGTGTLLGPTGITSDGTAFYIADQNEANPSSPNPATDGSRIRKLTAAGQLTNYAGSSTHGSGNHATNPSLATFHFPRNLTYAGGNLYIADMFNSQLRQINIASGAVTTLVGVNQAATAAAGGTPVSDDAGKQLCFPAAIAVDGTDLYFTEWHRNDTSGRATSRVRKYDTVADTLTTLALTGTRATLNDPTGIVHDGAGSLYVADTLNNMIKKITIATGAVTQVAGADPDNNGVGVPGYLDGTGDVAEILAPDGLAMDGAGRLYFTDGLGYVREISFPGGVATVRTLAGTGAPPDGFSGDWHADGKGSVARFQLPAGLWVNNAGTEIYVTDNMNKRVRKITITRP